jgi:hypothetical protein
VCAYGPLFYLDLWSFVCAGGWIVRDIKSALRPSRLAREDVHKIKHFLCVNVNVCVCWFKITRL